MSCYGPLIRQSRYTVYLNEFGHYVKVPLKKKVDFNILNSLLTILGHQLKQKV